jgi:hypothetical protein
MWDDLGYLRVRTLSNPSWPRDLPWLLGILRRSCPSQPGERRDKFDCAIEKARAYQSGQRTDEQVWDDFLDALDAYLCQQRSKTDPFSPVEN